MQCISRAALTRDARVNNIRILGTRASSGIKTTMQNVAIRHSLLFGFRHAGRSVPQGLLMHTPIDVPAPSRVVVYGNDFLLYRASTVTNQVKGREGILAGAIFLRQRQIGHARFGHPRISRTCRGSPPLTWPTTMSSPGEGWSAGPQTFVSDTFWSAVRAKPVTDRTNPLTFKHFVGFNHVQAAPGFAAGHCTARRRHASRGTDLSVRPRSVRSRRIRSGLSAASPSWPATSTRGTLRDSSSTVSTRAEYVKEIEAGAKWPRTKTLRNSRTSSSSAVACQPGFNCSGDQEPVAH